MPAPKQFIFATLLVLTLITTAAAQPGTGAPDQRTSLTITAVAVGDRVRITAPASVVQLHLEVYSATGQRVFDNEVRGGNVFDWHLQDGQAQRLAVGAYVCVITAKSVSGKLTQKIGTVEIEEKSVSVGPTDAQQLSAPQAQAIGPVEEDSSWTIPAKDEQQTATVIAHDGADGQMIRGRGALTFRIGNFFTGNDQEQMRLTEGGDLGIGTSEPKAKLDVAGTILAQRFLVAKPKSDASKESSPDTLTTEASDFEALIAGTGTQNRVAKWIDNAGTLGDSAITETTGFVGIGTTNPTQALEVANGRILTSGSQTLATPVGILEIGTTVTNNNNASSGIRMRNLFNGTANLQQALDVAPTFSPSASIALARGFISAAFFAPPPGVTITDAFGGNAVNVYSNTNGAVTNGTAFAINSPIVFGALKPGTQYGVRINNQGIGGTANSYGLFVDAQSGSTNSYSAIFAGGNVGIGTTTPAARLHVAGSSSSTATPIAIVESSGVQMPISFRSSGIEHARIRANTAGDLVFATTNGTDKDIFFRAGDDTSTDMFIQSSTGNVGIGTTSPDQKLDVNNGSILSSGSSGGRLGANNPNNQSASVNLDWFNDIARIRYGGSGVGASAGLLIQGQGDDTKLRITDSGSLIVTGKLFFHDESFNPADAAPPQDLCAREVGNSSPIPWQITLCSSSIRYKEDVRDFTPGLHLANRLRPVSFRWKGGSRTPDFGLVAEEVAQVEPLLVTRNGKGEIEGVKYDRIGVVLLNAVQEQQAQIKAQQEQLQAKDKRIANLAVGLARYESRLASLERSVARGKRTKRPDTVRINSTGKRGLRRATPSKAD